MLLFWVFLGFKSFLSLLKKGRAQYPSHKIAMLGDCINMKLGTHHDMVHRVEGLMLTASGRPQAWRISRAFNLVHLRMRSRCVSTFPITDDAVLLEPLSLIVTRIKQPKRRKRFLSQVLIHRRWTYYVMWQWANHLETRVSFFLSFLGGEYRLNHWTQRMVSRLITWDPRNCPGRNSISFFLSFLSWVSKTQPCCFFLINRYCPARTRILDTKELLITSQEILILPFFPELVFYHRTEHVYVYWIRSPSIGA